MLLLYAIYFHLILKMSLWIKINPIIWTQFYFIYFIFNENFISIQISLKYIPKGPIHDNKPA